MEKHGGYQTATKIAENDRRFTYHAPFGNQADRYGMIRAEARRFANMLTNECPDSREASLALTKLEECVMWANAAIARNESLLEFSEQTEGAGADDGEEKTRACRGQGS